MDKCKEQFEEWAKSEELDTVKYGATDVYCYPETHAAWLVWQASRQALVVQLPKGDFAIWANMDMIHGYKAAISDVANLLDAAGVNHK